MQFYILTLDMYNLCVDKQHVHMRVNAEAAVVTWKGMIYSGPALSSDLLLIWQ